MGTVSTVGAGLAAVGVVASVGASSLAAAAAVARRRRSEIARTPPGPAITTARRSSPDRWSPPPVWRPANAGDRAFSHPSIGDATNSDE